MTIRVYWLLSMASSGTRRCFRTCVADRTGEGFEKAALFAVKMRGQCDGYFSIEVAAMLWMAQMRHALTTQTEGFAVGGSSRDTQQQAAPIGRWNLNFAAKDGDRQGNFYLRAEGGSNARWAPLAVAYPCWNPQRQS